MRKRARLCGGGPTRIDWFWDKVHKSDGCWLWTAATFNGYGVFGIGGKATVRAHRFSWTIEHGEIPEGMDVCHRCDNRACVRPDHLFVGTRADNMRDAAKKLRMGKVLNASQARAIRTMCQGTILKQDVAKKFGVSPTTVGRIASGRIWPYA